MKVYVALEDTVAAAVLVALQNASLSPPANAPQPGQSAPPAVANRDPALIYPGDPDFPLGGPAAARGEPILRPVPNMGNPAYREGDHLPGWSATGEALAQAALDAVQSGNVPAQVAANRAIAIFIGVDPDSDFSTGTAANTASANFWRANNPTQGS